MATTTKMQATERFTSQRSPATRLLAARLGVAADALAASGATEEQAAAIMDSARASSAKLAEQLKLADAGVRNARQSQQGVEAAKATLKATEQSAKDSVLKSLSTEQRKRLDTFCRNRQRGIPAHFLVVERTEREWLTLREAVAAGSGRSKTAQAIIDAAESDSSVKAAKLGLERVAAIRAAMGNTSDMRH